MTTIRKRGGPSIADVARLAGVSSQTVSRVSTGSDKVRPATKERVLAAMDQLGYSPNHAARALRSGSFNTIGLMAHGLERTGQALTMEALVNAAEAEGYSVTIMNVSQPGSPGWADAATRLSHQAIDGLVVLRADSSTPERLVLPPRLPVAVADSRLVGHYPAVSSNHMEGSIAATKHLLSLGHEVVHHIAGPEDSDPAVVRAAAWTRTLEGAGIPAPPVWRGDWTAQSGYELGREIAGHTEVTAIFCANDEMAIGAMLALQESGRSIPGDISIVGFDDLALSAYTQPPLTTVRQDFHRIGRELLQLVLRQIRGTPMVQSERVLVPTDLMVRGTTAPPPSR